MVSYAELAPGNTAELAPYGLLESPIIGARSPDEKMPAGKMAWPHGFHLRHLAVEPGASSKRHARDEEEVLLLQSGTMTLSFSDGDVDLVAGDVFTTPIGVAKTIANHGTELAETYIVRGSDQPAPPRLID